MPNRRNYSSLCRLIDSALLHSYFTLPISKDQEARLLVTLSHALKEIHLSSEHLDDSETETDEETCSIGSSGGCDIHSDDLHCLGHLVSNLIVHLGTGSKFVQHVTGNVLVALSKFVAAFENNWESLICFLCVSLELAVSSILSCSLDLSNNRTWRPKNSLSSFIPVMTTKLKDANWFLIVGLIQVLRNILKHLKRDSEDELAEVYLKVVSSSISHLPWDLLNEIQLGLSTDVPKSGNDVRFLRTVLLPEVRVLFLGNLLQLFCALVEKGELAEAAESSIVKNQIACKIVTLVPQVMCWCLSSEEDTDNKCARQYFKHKLLMLIFRLSSQIRLEHCILLSWLQLLYKYFEDLLRKPIVDLMSIGGNYLEGSPFSFGIHDGEIKSVCSHHLQRVAVFIFLRCIFNMISLEEETGGKCACATLENHSDLSSYVECCCTKKGTSELYEWLVLQLPGDIFEDYNIYTQRCISFASSFLQLYLHEDDILFEMLLLLLKKPSHVEKRHHVHFWTSSELEMDILLQLSSIFNPLHLFHLFLSKLQYDNQIILDYLISKDTGITSAEYLLRCLPIVCDSWNSFVMFPKGGEVQHQFFHKRRKVTPDGSDCQVDLSSTVVEDDVVALMQEDACQRDGNEARDYCGSKEQPFEHAKKCLLQLKTSIESLHKKHLFPYNPEALLRRSVFLSPSYIGCMHIHHYFQKPLPMNWLYKSVFTIIWSRVIFCVIVVSFVSFNYICATKISGWLCGVPTAEVLGLKYHSLMGSQPALLIKVIKE